MSTKEMALVYPKSGVGWQASWRLKPRLGGQRVAKPAYAGWVLANGSRRRPTSRRREPPSRRGFNRQLANPDFWQNLHGDFQRSDTSDLACAALCACWRHITAGLARGGVAWAAPGRDFRASGAGWR